MTALMVIAPLTASPIFTVPAVMRSSSASVRPSCAAVSSVPTLMAKPAVFGTKVTVFGPKFSDADGTIRTESAVTLRLPVPVELMLSAGLPGKPRVTA